VFDGTWYNVAARKSVPSGTLSLDARRLNYNIIDATYTASISTSTIFTGTNNFNFYFGSVSAIPAQMYAQEVRIWSRVLQTKELVDHTYNFQSYGVVTPTDLNSLQLHWRLNDNLTGSVMPYDWSGNGNTGTASGFNASISPYKKFLFDYNYIAPADYGWLDDKIRIFNTSELKPADVYRDHQLVALEFNMVDALNEDISQTLALMDNWNNYLGQPAMRFRENYQDIDAMRTLYFKRLQGRLNFRVFADMLDFFDRSFITMVQKLLPARAVFMGDEFVVESHMLERPKHQWAYRRQDRRQVIEGSIIVYSRVDRHS
jgi:hypothetical protein